MLAYTKIQTGVNCAFPDFSFVKLLHISLSQHMHYCYNFYWNLSSYSRSLFVKMDNWFERVFVHVMVFRSAPWNEAPSGNALDRCLALFFFGISRNCLEVRWSACAHPYLKHSFSHTLGRLGSHRVTEVGIEVLDVVGGPEESRGHGSSRGIAAVLPPDGAFWVWHLGGWASVRVWSLPCQAETHAL